MAKIKKQAHRKIENACYKTHSDLTKKTLLCNNQTLSTTSLSLPSRFIGYFISLQFLVTV